MARAEALVPRAIFLIRDFETPSKPGGINFIVVLLFVGADDSPAPCALFGIKLPVERKFIGGPVGAPKSKSARQFHTLVRRHRGLFADPEAGVRYLFRELNNHHLPPWGHAARSTITGGCSNPFPRTGAGGTRS